MKFGRDLQKGIEGQGMDYIRNGVNRIFLLKLICAFESGSNTTGESKTS
jgi:hypothetical protein